MSAFDKWCGKDEKETPIIDLVIEVQSKMTNQISILRREQAKMEEKVLEMNIREIQLAALIEEHEDSIKRLQFRLGARDN
jgi:hypothetical protein